MKLHPSIGPWLLLACCGCFGEEKPQPESFTDACRRELQSRDQSWQVDCVRPLELRVRFSENRESMIQLDSLFEKYRANPKQKTALIHRLVQEVGKLSQPRSHGIDPRQIIPVARGPHTWKDEVVEKGSPYPGGDASHALHSQPFLGELTLYFVVLGDHHHRYLLESERRSLGLESGDLRDLAIGNLRGALNRVESVHRDGCYQIQSTIGHETALLLSDALWDGHQFPVKGDLVVTVPSAQLMLVSGTGESEGLETMRRLAKKEYESHPHPISTQWYLRRAGHFEIWSAP